MTTSKFLFLKPALLSAKCVLHWRPWANMAWVFEWRQNEWKRFGEAEQLEFNRVINLGYTDVSFLHKYGKNGKNTTRYHVDFATMYQENPDSENKRRIRGYWSEDWSLEFNLERAHQKVYEETSGADDIGWSGSQPCSSQQAEASQTAGSDEASNYQPSGSEPSSSQPWCNQPDSVEQEGWVSVPDCTPLHDSHGLLGHRDSYTNVSTEAPDLAALALAALPRSHTQDEEGKNQVGNNSRSVDNHTWWSSSKTQGKGAWHGGRWT